MKINELKEELGFKTKAEFNSYVAKTFGFKNVGSYANSSARKRYEAALCSFYVFVKSKERGENKQ